MQISPIKLQLVERIDHISPRAFNTFDKLNDPFQHSMNVNFV